jgi:hypothetical protein
MNEQLILELKNISLAFQEIYEYAEKGFIDHILLYSGGNKVKLDKIISRLEKEKYEKE